jgi:hypothetical protein
MERLLMWQSAQAGFSAREIGRCLSRDHHTVMRHTAASRRLGLITDLALAGHFREARQLVIEQSGLQDGPVTLDLIDELEEIVKSSVRSSPPFPY